MADEGAVIWRSAKGEDDGDEFHLGAVTAGRDGPRLVCARAWKAHSDVQVRIEFDECLADACRRYLPASSEGATANILDPHHEDERVIVEASGERTRYLWRSMTAGAKGLTGSYLLRTDGPDGRGLSFASVSGRPGNLAARQEFLAGTQEILDWADGEFGSPSPRR